MVGNRYKYISSATDVEQNSIRLHTDGEYRERSIRQRIPRITPNKKIAICRKSNECGQIQANPQTDRIHKQRDKNPHKNKPPQHY